MDGTGSLRSHPSPPASNAVRYNRRRGERGPSHWLGWRLEALKAAYLDHSRVVKEIAHSFHTSRRQVHRLAAQHGWPPRMSPEGLAHIRAAARAR